MASINVLVDDVMKGFRFERLIMTGYTGRNQTEVRAHIDELRAHGIPAPTQIPTLFACAPELLTTAPEISVLGKQTAGEGEVVLFVDGDEILIGVGSDHTDRELEVTDIPRAKQVCAKVVSETVWRFADVEDHWDELVLRSWVRDEGEDLLYQEGPLVRLLRPADVLTYVRTHTRSPLKSAILFAGTLPLRIDGFRPATTFTVELADPRRNRSLRCQYAIRVLDYLT